MIIGGACTRMSGRAWIACCALLWACGDDAALREDASMDGGAVHDAGADAGAHDAGMDAALDAETTDAAMDASRPDATLHDASDPAEAGADDAGREGGVIGPRTHGLLERIENTTCFLNGSPPLAIVAVDREPAYPMLDASGAIAIVRAPHEQLALVEADGEVKVFDEAGSGDDLVTVLDLSSHVRAGGLRSAAFRPDGGALIASYIPTADPLRIVIARFAIGDSGLAMPGSEQVLLEVPLLDAARSGGALAFLFDGTLAIAFGDGGDAALSEDTAELAGKVARISVDGANGYTIPSDNPLASEPGAREEIYALGLGAPTSCSIDRVTGRLWCADAGGATRDAILLVTAGATLRPILSFTRHSCGIALGFVSRDALLPDVQGGLVFGDACTSSIEAMRFDGSLVRSQDEITSLPAALRAFGEDSHGRMLIADAAGDVHALVRPATPEPQFPTTVGASGCLDDLALRTPAPSLIPFEVRAPLWSDGAKKHRFIALPGDATIGFTMEGAWDFPVGTIFMKEFLLDDDNDPSTEDRILETRFLIRRSASAWEGYSYMWDPERRDAFLLEGSEVGSYAMQPGELDSSGAAAHRHTFPDRAQCLLCHNAATGRALGLQTGRMNTDHDYAGFVENQLTAMAYVGLFSEPLPNAPDALPRFAEPSDEGAPIEARARSWLYANCSHCHRPGGPTPVPLDFRVETALAQTQTCGLTPRFAIAQLPDAKIIDPGAAANSELFFRMSRRDANQMPPLATLITDPVGVEVVQAWIDSLTACP